MASKLFLIESAKIFIRFPSLWIVQVSSSHEVWSDQHGNYYF